MAHSSDSEQQLLLDDFCDLEDTVAESVKQLKQLTKELNQTHLKLAKLTKEHRSYTSHFNKLSAALSLTGSKAPAKQRRWREASFGAVGDLSLSSRMEAVHSNIQALQQSRQRVGSVVLRLFLGRVNMKVWSEAERRRLKDEYHKFKARTNIIYLLFPLLQLAYAYYWSGAQRISWLVAQWWHLWLLYLYTSLTMRELILRVNGSRINSWWITHHIMAAVESFLSLLMMRSAFERYYFVFEHTTELFLLLAVVQLWQSHFQMRRDYLKRALGHHKSSDISTGEILNERLTFSHEYWLLCATLCVVYATEFVVGANILLFLFVHEQVVDLFAFECFLCGAVLVALGVGNAITLWSIVSSKTRAKPKQG